MKYMSFIYLIMKEELLSLINRRYNSMEREIICKIDLGTLDQHIYLLENDKAKDLGIANFSNLSNALVMSKTVFSTDFIDDLIAELELPPIFDSASFIDFVSPDNCDFKPFCTSDKSTLFISSSVISNCTGTITGVSAIIYHHLDSKVLLRDFQLPYL